MKYNDKIIIQDKDKQKQIVGFADVYDNNRQIYTTKNKQNLVTNAGREFIRKLFLYKSGLGLDSESVEFSSLKAVVFGIDSNATTPDMRYLPGDYKLEYSIEVKSVEDDEFEIDSSVSGRVKFTFIVDGKTENPVVINNMAFVLIKDSILSSGDGGEGKSWSEALSDGGDGVELFSRVLIDPTPIGANSSHTISYTLFF